MCTLRADSGLRAKPRPLRTLFSVHERSYLFLGCVLRGQFVPRTWFDHVPAGTVLAEQFSLQPVQTTRNGVYREHVPRTCSRWNCTENKYERPVYLTIITDWGEKNIFLQE